MVSDAAIRRVLRSDRSVALWGDLIRAAIAGGVLILLCLVCMYYAATVNVMFHKLHMNDFGKFYYSARAYLDAGDMYAPTVATSIPLPKGDTRQFLNMNPPHFQLLMVPVATLPPSTALGVWWGLSLICAGVTIALISRELGLRWTPSRALWATALILASALTGTVIATGQLTFLLVLPVTAAWIAARRGDWNRAAYILGLLASIKPFFGIFAVYLLLTRKLGALTRMIGALAAITLAGLVIVGVEPYGGWIRALSGVDWAWAPMNGAVLGVLTRTLANNPFFQPLVVAPELITPLWVAGITVVAGSAFWVLLRDPERQSDRAFCGLLLTAQLVSPLGWVYYLWFAAGPMIAVVRDNNLFVNNKVSVVLLSFALLGLLCPHVVTIAGGDRQWAGLTLGSIYGWATFFLWGAWLSHCAGLHNSSRGSRLTAVAIAGRR
jgi:hypothetical protein